MRDSGWVLRIESTDAGHSESESVDSGFCSKLER